MRVEGAGEDASVAWLVVGPVVTLGQAKGIVNCVWKLRSPPTRARPHVA